MSRQLLIFLHKSRQDKAPKPSIESSSSHGNYSVAKTTGNPPSSNPRLTLMPSLYPKVRLDVLNLLKKMKDQEEPIPRSLSLLPYPPKEIKIKFKVIAHAVSHRIPRNINPNVPLTLLPELYEHGMTTEVSHQMFIAYMNAALRWERTKLMQLDPRMRAPYGSSFPQEKQ